MIGPFGLIGLIGLAGCAPLHRAPARSAPSPVPEAHFVPDVVPVVLAAFDGAREISDEARYITGTELVVDGGLTARSAMPA